VRILLVEGRDLRREGISAIIEREPDMIVVAEHTVGAEAGEIAGRCRPEVAIVSARTPDSEAVEAARAVAAASPASAVIALCPPGNERLERELREAGVARCLSEDCSAADLVGAIRDAAPAADAPPAGVAEASPRWGRKSESGPQKLVAARLTPREREVLGLLADGWSTRHIAEHLHISVKTVETHRANLSAKLELRSLAELTKFAVLAGLTSLER